jgi:hypothetical protein
MEALERPPSPYEGLDKTNKFTTHEDILALIEDEETAQSTWRWVLDKGALAECSLRALARGDKLEALTLAILRAGT